MKIGNRTRTFYRARTFASLALLLALALATVSAVFHFGIGAGSPDGPALPASELGDWFAAS